MNDDDEVQVDVVDAETAETPPKSANGCLTAAKWGCIVVSTPIVGFVVLLIWASSGTEWEIKAGKHLGGSPMNVEFDYVIKGQTSRFHTYFIVVESADGTTRDQNIHGLVNARGTFRFGRFGAPQNVEGPVQVWIEKEDINRGGRSRCSNVLRIRTNE